jgi:hypothetical protein
MLRSFFFGPTNAHVKSMHSYFVHNLKQALEPSHLIEILQSFGKYDKKFKQDFELVFQR